MSKWKKKYLHNLKRQSNYHTRYDMVKMLQLLGREFKITMFVMLKNLMNRVDNMNDQMANFNSSKNYKTKK